MVNNQNRLFELKKTGIAFLVFLLIYPLDSIAYVLEGYLSFNIPVGFLGVLLAFFSIAFCFLEKGLFLKHIFWYFLFFSPIVFLVAVSHRSSLVDYYFIARSFAFFYSGFCFYRWLAYHKENNIGFCFWTLFVTLAMVLSIIDSEGLNYLRISDGFLVFSFLLISMSKSKFEIVVIFIVSMIVIYLLGSRFSIAVYFFSVFCLFFLRSGLVLRGVYVVLGMVLTCLLYFIGYYYFVKLESIHDNRLLRLIFATSKDTSLSGRSQMLYDSIEVFLSNPVFGSYKYYQVNGVQGAYAHNFMSLWAEFGVFGMMYTFFIFIICFLAIQLSIRMLYRENSGAKFIFLCTICLLLGLLFSKSYNWSSMYYFIGAALAFLSMNRGSLKKNEDYILSSTSS